MFFPIPSDPSGRLNFSSKAVLHADGVDFSSGQSYKINMSELELSEELGKGAFGTVQRVFHKPTKVIMAMKVSRRTCRFLVPSSPSALAPFHSVRTDSAFAHSLRAGNPPQS